MKPGLYLLIGIILFWYPLSLIHEFGHILSVVINGGTFIRIDWRYYIFSETIREQSSYPVIDIWTGPIFGSLVPLIFYLSLWKYKFSFILGWFSSICLIGNGIYIGLGGEFDGGDGSQLIGLGVDIKWLCFYGFVSFVSGIFILDIITKSNKKSAQQGDAPETSAI